MEQPTLDNDRKKVVNTEEQNEPVNPGDRVDEDTVASNEEPTNTQEKNPAKNQERETEVERPHRIEGDDASGIDRKIPKL